MHKPYRPTPDEARRDLRRWSEGRRQHAPALGPVPWQVVAAETLLAELERRDLEERGLVVTDLAEWEGES